MNELAEAARNHAQALQLRAFNCIGTDRIKFQQAIAFLHKIADEAKPDAAIPEDLPPSTRPCWYRIYERKVMSDWLRGHWHAWGYDFEDHGEFGPANFSVAIVEDAATHAVFTPHAADVHFGTPEGLPMAD